MALNSFKKNIGKSLNCTRSKSNTNKGGQRTEDTLEVDKLFMYLAQDKHYLIHWNQNNIHSSQPNLHLWLVQTFSWTIEEFPCHHVKWWAWWWVQWSTSRSPARLEIIWRLDREWMFSPSYRRHCLLNTRRTRHSGKLRGSSPH